MSIVGTLPNDIEDGQQANALPVMQNLQFIADQVNANASPIGSQTFTDFGNAALNGTTLASAVPVVIMKSTAVLNDTLSEWSNSAFATFTPATTGIYQFNYNGYIRANAADMSASGLITINLYSGGSIITNAINQLTWPFSGTVTQQFGLSLFNTQSLTAGAVIDCRVQVPTFSTGAVEWHGFISVRRLA